MVKYSTGVADIDVQLRCLLRDRRNARGYSQRQFEVLSGTSRSQLSRYENDLAIMNVATAAKFALLLGCTIDDLYEYERA